MKRTSPEGNLQKPINPEEIDSNAAGLDTLESKILENIVDKVGGGGVPTEREMRLLKSAMSEKGQGRPSGAVRLTIEHAATEFDLDRKTLTKALRAAGVEAGGDGKYSIGNICQAKYGNNPRDDREREQAENFRLRNQELRGQRVPPDDVFAVWEEELQGMAVILKTNKGKVLTEELINEIFAGLRGRELPLPKHDEAQ